MKCTECIKWEGWFDKLKRILDDKKTTDAQKIGYIEESLQEQD